MINSHEKISANTAHFGLEVLCTGIGEASALVRVLLIPRVSRPSKHVCMQGSCTVNCSLVGTNITLVLKNASKIVLEHKSKVSN